MIITGIETVPLRIPCKPGREPAASVWGAAGSPAVDSLLVKVTTDHGCEGWGEAFGFLGVPVTQRAIDDLIAPLCIGKDAARVAPLMHELQEKLQVFRGGSVTLALVRTRMGGPGALGEIGPGADTQVWLATSDEAVALRSGRHFHHRRPVDTHPAVTDPRIQEALLAACRDLTGQALPGTHWPPAFTPADAGGDGR